MNRFPSKPPTTVWGTYLRCHDDIGWAIDDTDAASVGLNGFEHRRFLADYYAGNYPMSDARGLVFQENLATGDRRISGMAASLLGVEAALDSADEVHLDLALRRHLLAHQIILGFGGLPLIYMGDELALTNNYDYVDDPSHADDNRWLHRPRMPWNQAARRHVEHSGTPRVARHPPLGHGSGRVAQPRCGRGDGDLRPREPGGPGLHPAAPTANDGGRVQRHCRGPDPPALG